MALAPNHNFFALLEDGIGDDSLEFIHRGASKAVYKEHQQEEKAESPTLLKPLAAPTPENPEGVFSGKTLQHSSQQYSIPLVLTYICTCEHPIGPRAAGHVGMLVLMLLKLRPMGGNLGPLCIALFECRACWAYSNITPPSVRLTNWDGCARGSTP
ncbi:hypothetical protein SLEP1_g42780 [Rubroshorea leprosula]|uniref:Uncharacterized protein n=1 Tax=Rubroshorea leprosula TaxID=152421 RepID=A0AAV5LAY8_9ROSI|nr:hypothetical protein SLEP1_g42780 [Rubroshorea leprosula]